MEIDDRLAKLMQQLGAAINQSLADSDTVSDALADIREAGYDIFLVLEATIGFHKRREVESPQSTALVPTGELLLSAQDTQFLKSLKIRLSGVEENS